eukprot:11359511-Prorocentrum_lima.AAC.1
MASSMAGEAAASASALVERFAVASRTLQRGDYAAMARLVEVAKAFLAGRAGELVASAGGAP